MIFHFQKMIKRKDYFAAFVKHKGSRVCRPSAVLTALAATQQISEPGHRLVRLVLCCSGKSLWSVTTLITEMMSTTALEHDAIAAVTSQKMYIHPVAGSTDVFTSMRSTYGLSDRIEHRTN